MKDRSGEMKTSRWSLAALGVTLVCGCNGAPVLVGYSPPVPVDAGAPAVVFPTAMGDEFAVDAPITLADNGVSQVARAFDGQLHLLVWTSPRGLLAVRYDLAGTRLDATPILLAPVDLLRAGIAATARPGGGFTVFWAGPLFFGGSTISLPGYGALYAARVERDGTTTLPASAGQFGDDFRIYDVGASGPNESLHYRMLRMAFVEPQGVRLLTMGFEESSLAFGYARNFDDAANMWGVLVPVSPVLGGVAFTRLGDRDYLATISGDATARVLELRALTPRGDYPTVANDPGQVIFSAPINMTPARLQGHRYVSLEAVSDRVVLVWRDEGPNPVLRAVSVLPTSASTFDVSSPVVVAQTGSFGYRDVATAVVGGSVLVGVRGIAGDSSATADPLAVAVDPATLLPVSAVGASQALGDGYLRDCSWDGQACLVVVGLGSLSSFALAQRVPMGGELSPLAVEQALPGQVNQQSQPVAGCAATTCLLLWSDQRELSRGDPRAVRVDKGTGLPIDGESFSLFAHTQATYATAAALSSTGSGFVAAEGRCSDGTAQATMQLVVRTVPEQGELGALQVVDFPDHPCAAWGSVTVAADASSALVVGLLRDAPDPGEPSQVLLATLGADGVARARPLALPAAPTWIAYSVADAVVTGGRATLALQSGQSWTTVVLDLADPTLDTVGLSAEVDPNSSGPRRLLAIPGNPHLTWLELAWPSRSTTGERDWALTSTELDDAARPLGPPLTLTGGRGEAYGLQVAADERGLAVLTAQRTFQSEHYSLVFRRFDAQPSSQAPEEGRVVATGIYTPGHALASAGNGQWLTAYAHAGIANGMLISYGADASRVFGRFVYEAPPQ